MEVSGVFPATAEHLAALQSLEQAVFSTDRLSCRSMRRLMLSASATFLVALTDQGPAGYILVFYRRNSKSGRIYSLAVQPWARGGGVGKRLIAAAEADARARGCVRIRLEVRKDNPAAAALYAAAGYTCYGERANYYEDGEAALLWRKQLAV